MKIPFSLLPGFSELFTDYVQDFDTVRRFYEYDYSSLSEIKNCIESVSNSFRNSRHFFRKDLTEILRVQNKNFETGETGIENISLLNSHDTFAVVTGQQVGLLTGPLYTIYKALNTIQLSEKLNREFPDHRFVPVFWMEADDHDFLEVNNFSVITKENELKHFRYFEKGIEEERYTRPVGEIVFNENIDATTNELSSSLAQTDFSNELFDSIKANYTSGSSFKNAFAKFLNRVIGDRGLIIIDPTDPEFKNLLTPVFEKALNSANQISEKIIETTVELEANYTAQIKPRPINLFYIHEGSRYLLEPREGGNYALKNSRKRFTGEELAGELHSTPHKFSWNVVTRPICQDYLLPTVAYVGGPSEISYFAQLKEVYKIFGVTMPVIYPRTSVTILDGRTVNFLEKHDSEFAELFNEKEFVRKLISLSSENDPEEIFAKMKEELNAVFYTADKQLKSIDQNQALAFSKRASQFVDSLDVAKEKFLSAQAKQNEVVSVQLKKIMLNIYPNSILQERVLNISMFLNKYGPELIDTLFSNISIDDFNHQLIDPTPSKE